MYNHETWWLNCDDKLFIRWRVIIGCCWGLFRRQQCAHGTWSDTKPHQLRVPRQNQQFVFYNNGAEFRIHFFTTANCQPDWLKQNVHYCHPNVDAKNLGSSSFGTLVNQSSSGRVAKINRKIHDGKLLRWKTDISDVVNWLRPRKIHQVTLHTWSSFNWFCLMLLTLGDFMFIMK